MRRSHQMGAHGWTGEPMVKCDKDGGPAAADKPAPVDTANVKCADCDTMNDLRSKAVAARAEADALRAERDALKARKVTLPQRFAIDAVEGHDRSGYPEATLEVEANDAGAWIHYSETADAIRAAVVEVEG